MITIPQLDEIQKHLSELSRLFTAFENKELQFTNHVLIWVERLIVLFNNNRLPEVSDIVLLKAEIVINLAQKKKDGEVKRIKYSQKAVQIADILRRIGNKAVDAIKIHLELINEGERVARQIASIVKAKGIKIPSNSDWGTYLALWKSFSKDNDLISIATHLTGIVGLYNAVFLFIKVQSDI